MMPSSRFVFVPAALLCFGCAATQPDATQTVPAAPASAEPGPESPAQTTEPPVAQPSSTDADSVLFIHEKTVACEGEGPMKCLQVRDSDAGNWTRFYDSIEGFDHEEGYRYELRVEVTDVANPPADGSSKRYRLLEVVSKKKAAPDAPSP